MKMKRKILLPIVALLLGLGLESCKCDNQGDSSSSTSLTNPTTSEPTSEGTSLTPSTDVTTVTPSTTTNDEPLSPSTSGGTIEPSTTTSVTPPPSTGDDNPLEEPPASLKLTVNPFATIAVGSPYTYLLSNVQAVSKVNRVRVAINVDYKGASVDQCWYGGQIKVGSTIYDFSSSSGYEVNVDSDNNNVNESTTIYFNVEVANLDSTQDLVVDLQYAARTDFDVVVNEVNFYYTSGRDIITETVDYNHVLYNGSSATDLEVLFKDFTKKGDLEKIEINVTTTSNADYKGGTFYFTGLTISAKNTVNLGDVESGVNGVSYTGSINIYPEGTIDLNDDASFSFTCWWAPTSSIVVNSVTMHTCVETTPEPVTNLVAQPGNAFVNLSWDKSIGASSYDIYCNNEFLANTKNTSYYARNLANGIEYSFYVVAKNSAGASNPSVIASATPSADISYDHTLDDLNSELENMIGSEGINTMFNAAKVSTATHNNYRLKTAIEKMKRNDNVTVGFIGGSITVGENATIKHESNLLQGYASYTFDYLKENYGGDNTTYKNVAISGTGSEIGIVRLQNDLLKHNPDIIFLEFAANNGGGAFYQESFEGMVRNCLNAPNSPAVVIVFSANDYTGHAVEDYMTKIGAYYGLPMISVDKALKSVCTVDGNGNLTTTDPIFDKYINDGTHPTDQGHQLMGKIICNTLKGVINEELDSEPTVPTAAMVTDMYDDFVELDNTSTGINLGGWIAADTKTGAVSQSHEVAFHKGWKLEAAAENTAMTFNITARNFIVCYCNLSRYNNSNIGTIVVSYKVVGTNNVQTVELTPDSGGWDNVVAREIFQSDIAQEYEISISMKDNNTLGMIFGMGYSK